MAFFTEIRKFGSIVRQAFSGVCAVGYWKGKGLLALGYLSLSSQSEFTGLDA